MQGLRIVVAIGGNALLQRGERPDAVIQRRHIQQAASALAPLAMDNQLLIVHGNGPQVGMLAQESASDPGLSEPYPLDVLVAQTQGMIGYWLSQALHNAGVGKRIVGLLTQIVVNADDPAFVAPTKFIGPSFTKEQAEKLGRDRGWVVARDGDAWRRVVASPLPQRVVEQDSIDASMAAGDLLICAGGGGVPVTDSGGQFTGADAVVDKDFTASHIAVAVDADWLLILTDVPGVMRDFGSPQEERMPSLDVGHIAAMSFAAGSMGPKIMACSQFVTQTGKSAAIGALTDPVGILAGTTGTTIHLTAGATLA